MPTKKNAAHGAENPSVKDPELYEELLVGGASEQKAARISNAALKGYSGKRKNELIAALRNP